MSRHDSKAASALAIDDDVELVERLSPIILRLARRMRREAQRTGASSLDRMILTALAKEPGLGVSDLAEREHMTKPAMSVHVRRLGEAGWVARQDSGLEDGRRVALTITPSGRRALLDAKRYRDAWLAQQLAMLTESEKRALNLALAPLERLRENAK